MLFATSGLLSKWGFSDGDLLDDLLWDHDIRGADNQAVLATIVEQYVVPALDQEVETERIGTLHNPIRAVTVDGEEWGDRVYQPFIADGVLTPEYVEVPDDVILDLARDQ